MNKAKRAKRAKAKAKESRMRRGGQLPKRDNNAWKMEDLFPEGIRRGMK